MKHQIPANYREAVDYIEELPKFTEKHPLKHTKKYLEKLQNPAENCKVIHVAGTNGKGSVCAYLQAVLQAEGKKTGFFTSPHLIKINERIQIDREEISDDTFYDVFCEAYHVAQEMEQEGEGHPSYFEFLFGMGMKAFEKAGVEYIILETGLGGRLDATNAVESPVLTVITSISLDHTAILGDTIEKIAFEKAGIIKEGVPVIFDGSRAEATEVIRRQAEKMHAPCREISKNAFEIREVTRNHIAFSRRNAYDKDVIWQVPICGCYQVMNAQIALEALECLLGNCESEPDRRKKWVDAVASIHWEGRMEEAAEHVLVDGAHNPGAIEAFVESIHLLYPEPEPLPIVVFSAVVDKDYEWMIAYLCRYLPAKLYIVTEIPDKRRVSAEELKKVFERYTDCEVVAKSDIGDALKEAYDRRGESEIYCLGSLYLVGAIKEQIAGGNNHAELR